MRPRAAILLLPCLLVPLLGARPWKQQAEAPRPLVLTGATLVDARGRQADATLLIRGDRIAAVGAAGEIEAPADARVLELGGRFVIPGLVDTHVHLSGPGRAQAEKTMGFLLRGGVTTVRDMAGDARFLAGLQVAVIAGDLEGPEIVYSALMAGPAFMQDPRVRAASSGVEVGSAPWLRTVTPDLDIDDAMAQAVGAGARLLKLYAALDADQVARLTAAAHAHDLRVWAHATVFPAKPSELVAAGVDGLTHAPYLVWEGTDPGVDFSRRSMGDFAGTPPDGPAIERLLEQMAARGTFLEPTLAVFWPADDELADARRVWSAAVTRRAAQLGVPLIAGTDVVGDPDKDELPALHDELALLVHEAGLTPRQALTAATLQAARALGLAGSQGTLEPGRRADLVVLAADPELDIANTRRIVEVIHGGRILGGR